MAAPGVPHGSSPWAKGPRDDGFGLIWSHSSRGHAMADDKHDHSHAHDHDHGSELSEMQLRVRALESILTEKGYVDPAALDQIIEAYETRIGPHNGARAV